MIIKKVVFKSKEDDKKIIMEKFEDGSIAFTKESNFIFFFPDIAKKLRKELRK